MAKMKNMKNQIENKLLLLQPKFLQVVNESYRHAVPEGSESHFKVTIVSETFNGKSLVARHQLVNATLTNEIMRAIHALALHTLTSTEWLERNKASRESPPCLGGSAADQTGSNVGNDSSTL